MKSWNKKNNGTTFTCHNHRYFVQQNKALKCPEAEECYYIVTRQCTVKIKYFIAGIQCREMTVVQLFIFFFSYAILKKSLSALLKVCIE